MFSPPLSTVYQCFKNWTLNPAHAALYCEGKEGAWLTFPDQYSVSVEVFFQEDLG